MENWNTIEEIQTEREKLKSLELEDKYVFHGSGEDLNSLEPRQAHSFKDGVQEKDGSPAVFASNRADYAIFMALINKKNCPLGVSSSVGFDSDKGFEFGISKKTLDQLNDDSFGYVYVFDKNNFNPKKEGSVEYLSKDGVEPIQKIKVFKRDLPENINLI